jgi:hypothetical protein
MIDHQQLERVGVVKYLGIQIDEKLNLTENFHFILKKINFLGRIRSKLTLNSRKLVYQTIISPHIDYCSSILYLPSKEQLKRLQLLQSRAMRIVLNCHWRTSREWMLNILGWQSIKERINFNTMVLIYKIKKGMVPGYLTDKLHYRHNNRYELRNADAFKLPKVNKVFTQNLVFYNGLKQYNELPNEMKQS